MRESPADHGTSVVQHRYFSYLFTQKRPTQPSGNAKLQSDSSTNITNNNNPKKTKNIKRNVISQISSSLHLQTTSTNESQMACSSNDLISAMNDQDQTIFQSSQIERNSLVPCQSKEKQESAVILLRRSKHVQTNFLSIYRTFNNNAIFLEDDTCVRVNDCKITQVPLREFKRIARVKQFPNEGKIEVEIESDAAYTPMLVAQQLEFDHIDSRLKQIEASKQSLNAISSHSNQLILSLQEQTNIKKEQLLNKIDFKRKYVFALEYTMPHSSSIAKFSNVLYSQSLLQLLGLDGSVSIESYLLQNGLVDLHSLTDQTNASCSLDNSWNNEISSQYLRPIGQRDQEIDLQTLDGISMKTLIHHRLIEIGQEFFSMFGGNQALQAFPKQYVSLYDIEISYDEVKRIEEIRKNGQQLVNIQSNQSNTSSRAFIEKFYPQLLF